MRRRCNVRRFWRELIAPFSIAAPCAANGPSLPIRNFRPCWFGLVAGRLNNAHPENWKSDVKFEKGGSSPTLGLLRGAYFRSVGIPDFAGGSNPIPVALYLFCLGNGTMVINAPVINGSDPGAVPGGSTIIPRLGIMGPKQDRRTSKGVSFHPVRYHRYRFKQYSCKRQLCSGSRCCVSSNKDRKLSPGALQRQAGFAGTWQQKPAFSQTCLFCAPRADHLAIVAIPRSKNCGLTSYRAKAGAPDSKKKAAPLDAAFCR